MWQLTRTLLLVTTVAVVVAGCSNDEGGSDESVVVAKGAESARQAVEGVVDAIEEGEFADAGILAVSEHAALAALSEGASFADVADALRDRDPVVAANFWSGFAQGTGAFLTGTVTYLDGDTVSRDGLEFEAVRVLPIDGSERVVWVREVDGYRIDLFASFGGGLADKMLSPVERLLTAQTDDTAYILAQLRDVVPSLHVAADTPGVSAQTRQQILALVELITRLG